MKEVIRVSEMLSAVKWYFELKNLSLRNAISIRCPISAVGHKDLRLYYSQYFSGLLSATELLLEKEHPQNIDFKNTLYVKLAFEGHTDGEKNYLYLRELRNSIIHRGLDISSAAHIDDNFPMVIAPSPVTNRLGTISHFAFDFYLVHIIEKCEEVIGDIFLQHFMKHNFLEMRLDREELIERCKNFISTSPMPEQAKALAFEQIDKIDYNEVHRSTIKSLIDTLNEKILPSGRFQKS